MLLNLISLRYPGRYFRQKIFQLLAINARHPQQHKSLCCPVSSRRRRGVKHRLKVGRMYLEVSEATALAGTSAAPAVG